MTRESLSCALTGREQAWLSLGVKQCNPIGGGELTIADTMEEFSLVYLTVLFSLNNSFVLFLHPDCSNRYQNVCWFWFQRGEFYCAGLRDLC